MVNVLVVARMLAVLGVVVVSAMRETVGLLKVAGELRILEVTVVAVLLESADVTEVLVATFCPVSVDTLPSVSRRFTASDNSLFLSNMSDTWLYNNVYSIVT